MPPKRAATRHKAEDIALPTSRHVDLAPSENGTAPPALKRAKIEGGVAMTRSRQTNAAQASDAQEATVAPISNEGTAETTRTKKQPTSRRITPNAQEPETNAMDVNVDKRRNQTETRPWLTRPQRVDQQNLFVIYCRDNLVPGSIGPKDWADVASEFNERFKNQLKKSLAWNTLSKRCGQAKKIFLEDNPEYAEAVRYPVPVIEEHEEYEAENIVQGEHVQLPVEAPDGKETSEARIPEFPETVDCAPLALEFPDQDRQANQTEALDSGDSSHDHTNALARAVLGSYHPGDISPTQIAPVDRAKFHLRRRTSDLITFRFLDKHEAKLVCDDAQFIDYDTLVATSPVYARSAREDPEDTTIDVRKDISAKTVNVFIQIVAPVRAKELPAHYLWKANKPVPGVYDRFGAIEPEKIEWTVEALLELGVFAREMEVLWICDMVIDRLYWMFEQQEMLRRACATMANVENESVEIGGHEVFVGRRLPSVPNLQCSLSADDFDTQQLERIIADTVDAPTLKFIADLMIALGGKLDTVWLHNVPSDARKIFTKAAGPNPDSCLDSATRQQFCARYHHHAADEPCYTSSPEYSAAYYVNLLYSLSSQGELISMSNGLPSDNALMNILHAQSGTNTTLKAANSTQDMLSAEKMVMEMEMRLEDAKKGLARARDAGAKNKIGQTIEARRVAEELYTSSRVFRTKGSA